MVFNARNPPTRGDRSTPTCTPANWRHTSSSTASSAWSSTSRGSTTRNCQPGKPAARVARVGCSVDHHVDHARSGRSQLRRSTAGGRCDEATGAATAFTLSRCSGAGALWAGAPHFASFFLCFFRSSSSFVVVVSSSWLSSFVVHRSSFVVVVVVLPVVASPFGVRRLWAISALEVRYAFGASQGARAP